MSLSKMSKEMDDFHVKYIAFDLFDTIISRDVHPEYVKKLWSKEMVNQLRINTSYEDLYNLRVAIEAELRQSNSAQGMDSEFHYRQLAESMFEKVVPTDLSFDSFFEVMKSLEINTELRVQRVNNDCVEVLNYYKDKGKRIICVSDFYLPHNDIEEILQHHGLLEYFEKIYVSCDYLLTKASGRLYGKLLNELQLTPDSMIMIGDNVLSDYRKARKNGIRSILIDRTNTYKAYEKFWEEKNDYDVVVERSNLYQGLGMNENFEEIAFTLYYFIDRLYQTLLQNSVKNVFFLSREGEFLKRLFDSYREEQGYVKEQCINSHYLVVSRRSTFIASLDELEKETFEWLFLKYSEFSIYTFLSSLNFPEKDIIQISRHLPCDLHELIKDFRNSTQFKLLLKMKQFKDCYEKIRVDQKKNLRSYLEQQDVDMNSEGLHVVDIGWVGTIQSNIFRTLGGDVAVTGYYIGLIYDSSKTDYVKNKKYGILFETDVSKKSIETRESKVYGHIQIIFELLLMASHGSASGYVQSEHVVKALTKEDEKEEQLYIHTIKPVQEKMVEIFSRILNAFKMTVISHHHYRRDFMKIHTELILFPNPKEKEFFNSLYHLDTFGKIGFSTYKFPGE